jgi:hypothetical protein
MHALILLVRGQAESINFAALKYFFFSQIGYKKLLSGA